MLQLSDIQQAGVAHIIGHLARSPHKGYILADAMGVGKTAQAIAVARHVARPHAPVIIVCPAYLLYNWLHELRMWGCYADQDICVVDSSAQILADTHTVYIGSYNMITSPKIHAQLCRLSPALTICDEAHYLKSWNSQRANRILGTFKNRKNCLLHVSAHMLLLTGTPLLNNIAELYNIVIRIAPEVLSYMSRVDFYHRFATRVEYTPWQIIPHGVQNEEALKKLLAPIMLRRATLVGVPAPDIEYVYCDPSQVQELLRMEEEFLSAHNVDIEELPKLLNKKNTEAHEIAALRRKIALTKIPLIRDAVRGDVPCIIYAYHIEIARAIHAALGRSAAYIDGSTPVAMRQRIIAEFQGGDITCIVATMGALSEGVTLTAAQAIYFCELDWTPARIAQAIGRAVRRGQTESVIVRKYVYDAGIERRIMQLLAQKQATIHAVVGD